ncbi:amidohydrolase family protein [Natronobiforma cellulositropha]
MLVVDADAHLLEKDEDLLPYMDEYPGMKRYIEGASDPSVQIRTQIYSGPNTVGIYDTDARDLTSSVYDKLKDDDESAHVDTKLEEMNDFGIDVGVVTGTTMLHINTVNYPQAALAYANAYNKFLRHEILDAHEGIKAAALVSQFEPEKGAEEIDEMGSEEDIVAVAMPNGGLRPPFGSKEFDPIYQAAVDNDLPILLHPTTSLGFDYPATYRDSHTYAESRVVSQPWRCMWDLTTSLTRGLPERFPDLQIVFQEAGIAWVPYTLWRLDDTYMEHPDQVPLLEQLPSEYVEDRYYFTTQPLGHTSGANLASAFDLLGPESIMFSSDLPHGAFDSAPEILRQLTPHFDEETIRAIMGETAASVFGLE